MQPTLVDRALQMFNAIVILPLHQSCDRWVDMCQNQTKFTQTQLQVLLNRISRFETQVVTKKNHPKQISLTGTASTGMSKEFSVGDLWILRVVKKKKKEKKKSHCG